MKTKYQFIYFDQFSKTPNIWTCRNNKSGNILGWIEYDAHWKQYVFRPEGYTQFSTGCMNDICDFIKQLK